MKVALVVVFATFAVVVIADDLNLQSGLRVKFGVGDGRGTKYYIPLPLNRNSAIARNWTEACRSAGRLPSLKLFCPTDRSVCVLYEDDKHGSPAGIQVALQKYRFKNAAFDWKTQGYSEWTIDGVDYWTMTQYFINEQYLAYDPIYRELLRAVSYILPQGKVWLTGFYGELLEIPLYEKELSPIWGSQHCMNGMGHHYLYNLTNRECASNRIFPWFILYHRGTLVAALWAAFGDFPADDGQDGFERPDNQITQMNFPDAPKCVVGLSKQTVSLHQWYVDEPWNVICDDCDHQ